MADRCYCELRENKLGVPGDLLEALVYPALQNTDCLLAGPECNTACEAQARKQYDIPVVIGEEGVLNKQNKDGVSLGSRICAAHNKPVPAPGIKLAVFAKAETCPKAQAVVELLGGEELKFCCLYGDHPFILTEKLLLYSPECMGLATPSGAAAPAAPAAGAAAAAAAEGAPAGAATSAAATASAAAAAHYAANPFLSRYNEHNNPFSPAAMFNPFAGIPGMGVGPQPSSGNTITAAMMAAMFGGGGQPGAAGKPGTMVGAGGFNTQQQHPLAQFYPMSAPMTMPPPPSPASSPHQQQQQHHNQQHHHHQSNPVQMMPYKAAPSSSSSSPHNAPG